MKSSLQTRFTAAPCCKQQARHGLVAALAGDGQRCIVILIGAVHGGAVGLVPPPAGLNSGVESNLVTRSTAAARCSSRRATASWPPGWRRPLAAGVVLIISLESTAALAPAVAARAQCRRLGTPSTAPCTRAYRRRRPRSPRDAGGTRPRALSLSTSMSLSLQWGERLGRALEIPPKNRALAKILSRPLARGPGQGYRGPPLGLRAAGCGGQRTLSLGHTGSPVPRMELTANVRCALIRASYSSALPSAP